jgi:uncharacterized protein (TIGR03000 family)
MFKHLIIPVLAVVGVLSTTESSWAIGPLRPHMMPRMVRQRVMQPRSMVVPHVGFVPQAIPSLVSPVSPRALARDRFLVDRGQWLRRDAMTGWAWQSSGAWMGSMGTAMSGASGYAPGGSGTGDSPLTNYLVPNSNSQTNTPAANAVVSVTLPSAGTVWVGDFKTEQGPISKDYVTAPLEAGQDYTYQVSARFVVAGLEVTPTKTITVHAGDRLNIDFSRSIR